MISLEKSESMKKVKTPRVELEDVEMTMEMLEIDECLMNDTEPTPTQKKPMLIGLLLCQGVAPLLYMNLGAFFPAYALRTYGLKQESVGLLFSIYQVAFLITAFWAGKNMHVYGRKQAVKSAILLMSAATLMFCFASTSHGVFFFYFLSCIARFMQGAAAGIVEVAVPAIIS